ncbi:Hsp70 family protein [Curvibacter sp. HBC61]|uniref:Hsp70 family protein n=1 Tax=Curvibacter cyanobacteriorum TaxID=3026422 RepID=A0ABT5N2V0_9BURK|nr:Hsp70 family protein [Curvibacter sp. HBC61]MDD0840644.1 Hsp70 family protein [Curvibacter sp. HBC61]
MASILPGALGIDFGTSNSAVAWAHGREDARLMPLEGQATTLPTALFFNAEDKTVHYGRDALSCYLAETEGRLMRSLKSLLGSPLLLEKTAVNNEQISFQDIIARFLAELVRRAEVQLGGLPQQLVLGRPVHFVDDDPERDQLAQDMLLQAAAHCGFSEVGFQLEPIAAALDYERRLSAETVVLVVDIGGGTSDFTVVRLGPQRVALADRHSDILATSGVHIGGTDYDQRLNLEQVMPLLGYRHLGPKGREVPSRVFFDLATWHLIHWQQTPKAVREAQELRVDYRDAQLHQRLMTVLRERFGHRLANGVEQAKIGCSSGLGPQTIDLSLIEAGLAASLSPQDLADHLQGLLAQVVACAVECVQRAGLQPQQLGAVYLTGGSSALKPFQQALGAAFPGVPLVEGDLFGGVASGLAYGHVR